MKYMRELYAYPPKHYLSNGVHRIAYHNVALATFMRAKATELLLNIAALSPDLQLVFLQTFFDDEGCVDYSIKRNSREIRGYQHDVAILKLVQKLLSNFGIISKVDERFFEVTITRKENLLKFKEQINFSPGVRVNGMRSNSVWKESLEKREILNRALASYVL
jgi:hypothetical protein